MSKISFINGQYIENYKAKISINDRSFHFADAVYEVIAIFEKKLVFWKEHLERLKSSLKHLDINYLVDSKLLKIKCEEIIERNDMEEGLIYLHISRGIQNRNHDWSNSLKPCLVISAINKGIFNLKEKPISLITNEDIRWKRAYIKSTSLLPNVILKKQAVKKGAGECVFKDNYGFITEATHSNIFLIKNKCLITPPLEKKILPGITRKKILDFAKDLNIKNSVKKFKEKDIYQADATFITNSSSFLVEANKLNGKTIKTSSGELITRIKIKFKEHIEKNVN